MSEMMFTKGKLVKVELGLLSIEEYAKKIINKELKSYCDTYLEQLEDEYYEKYIVHNGNLYEVIDTRCVEGEDIFDAEIQEDKTIDFHISYYNGGCSFNEAIEYALNNLTKLED